MTKKTVKRGRPVGTRNKKPSDSLALTADDLCAIIKLCGAQNVLSFQYRDLSVNFNSSDSTDVKTNYMPVDPQETRRESLQRQHDFVEEDLDYMKITDPVAFEALAMEGETVEEGEIGKRPQ